MKMKGKEYKALLYGLTSFLLREETMHCTGKFLGPF